MIGRPCTKYIHSLFFLLWNLHLVTVLKSRYAMRHTCVCSLEIIVGYVVLSCTDKVFLYFHIWASRFLFGLLFCGCSKRTSCSVDLKYVLCWFLMSLLLLIHNVIHTNDLNILLLVAVVLNSVALYRFSSGACYKEKKLTKVALLTRHTHILNNRE